MKQLCILFLTVLWIASASAVDISPETAAKAEISEGMAAMQMITAEDILAHKPRQLAKKYGVKLKFKERLALSIVRGKLKKARRKGHDLDTALDDARAAGSDFHLGGFLLGFLLGLLGWLLAILIWPRMGAGRSALFGLAIWLIIALFIII